MDDKIDFKFGKYDLNFLIRLKVHDFRKQDIENITEQQVRNYLFDIKWKSKKSLPMCQLVDDIMSLEFSEIFDYLSVQAVKDAHSLDLEAFTDFISK